MKPDVEPTVFGLSRVRTSPPRLVSAGMSSTERICGSAAGAWTESGVIWAPEVVSCLYGPPNHRAYTTSRPSVNSRQAAINCRLRPRSAPRQQRESEQRQQVKRLVERRSKLWVGPDVGLLDDEGIAVQQRPVVLDQVRDR